MGKDDDLKSLERELAAGAVVVGTGPVLSPKGKIHLSRNEGKYRHAAKGSEDGWLAEVVGDGNEPVRVVLFAAITQGRKSGISDLSLKIDGASVSSALWLRDGLADTACKLVGAARQGGCFSPGFDYVFASLGVLGKRQRRSIEISFKTTSQARY